MKARIGTFKILGVSISWLWDKENAKGKPVEKRAYKCNFIYPKNTTMWSKGDGSYFAISTPRKTRADILDDSIF